MKKSKVSTNVEQSRSCKHDRAILQHNKKILSESLADSIMWQIKRVIELHTKNGGNNQTMLKSITQIVNAYVTAQKDIDEERNPLVNGPPRDTDSR